MKNEEEGGKWGQSISLFSIPPKDLDKSKKTLLPDQINLAMVGRPHF
jgi:hypothetical protein